MGCASVPGPCVLEDYNYELVSPWFSVRLDSAKGLGTSCAEPIRLQGEYQACDEERCVPWKQTGDYGLDYPVFLAERWWVQVNYYSHRYLAAFAEYCGSYTADVLLLQLGDQAPTKVYFDSRAFKAVGRSRWDSSRE